MVRVVIGSGGRGALQGWLRVGHEGSLDNSGAKPKAGEFSPPLGRSSGFLAARKVVKVGCKLVQIVGSCKSLMIASCE